MRPTSTHELAFIGYELRERVANDPAFPLPDYPLGFGTSTMDSSLCRPCAGSGIESRDQRIFLYKTLGEFEAMYREISQWDAYVVGGQDTPRSEEDFAVFAYFLEPEIIPRLAELERAVTGKDIDYSSAAVFSERPPFHEFKLIGFDVVRGLTVFDQWESDVANEGIPRAVIEKHGALNEHGLFEDLESAVAFKQELLAYSTDESDPPVVAAICIADSLADGVRS